MDMNSKIPGGFSMQEILRLANSPAGRQLITMLQQQNGPEFQNAVAGAAAGDYSKAKRMIESVMSDPKAQQLLKELGR